MVQVGDVLNQRCKVVDIVCGAELRALSAEASGMIGSGPSVAVVDELHLLGLLGQRGLDLVHGLESGMFARAEPMICYITTAPVRAAIGIYSEVLGHTRKVVSGEIDDRRTLALLYEIPEGENYKDSTTWWRSNRDLGVPIQRAEVGTHRPGPSAEKFGAVPPDDPEPVDREVERARAQ